MYENPNLKNNKVKKYENINKIGPNFVYCLKLQLFKSKIISRIGEGTLKICFAVGERRFFIFETLNLLSNLKKLQNCRTIRKRQNSLTFYQTHHKLIFTDHSVHESSNCGKATKVQI